MPCVRGGRSSSSSLSPTPRVFATKGSPLLSWPFLSKTPGSMYRAVKKHPRLIAVSRAPTTCNVGCDKKWPGKAKKSADPKDTIVAANAGGVKQKKKRGADLLDRLPPPTSVNAHRPPHPTTVLRPAQASVSSSSCWQAFIIPFAHSQKNYVNNNNNINNNEKKVASLSKSFHCIAEYIIIIKFSSIIMSEAKKVSINNC